MQKALVHIIASALVAVLATMQNVQAQSKVTASTGIWPELQVSYGVGDNGLFFFQNQYRINTDHRFNDLKEEGLLGNFERIQFALGYEHAFSDHWRSGVLWRYALENYPKGSFYGAFLRHSGAVKGLYFNKQLLLEYVTQEDQHEEIRTHLSAELGKQFQISHYKLTPSLGYEAAIFSRMRETSTTSEERFIDRTRLRLNLTLEVNPRWHITPYFMRQTNYYYVEIPPVYDEDDVLVKNGYRTKRNRITPVVGLELKYNITGDISTGSFVF